MDNKQRKLFVIIQQSEGKFMPKMHRNTFGGRPDPLGGEFMRSPRPRSRNGDPTSMGMGGSEMRQGERA